MLKVNPSNESSEQRAAFLPTVDAAAENLSPEADGAVGVPGLGVDAYVTGDSGNRQESEHRTLWVLVASKDLYNSM